MSYLLMPPTVTYALVTIYSTPRFIPPLQWCHNEHDGVSNHQRLDCLLTCRSRRWSKKTSKLRITVLCEGNSPVTGEFPAQKATNAESVSTWWRHRGVLLKRWWDNLLAEAICALTMSNTPMPEGVINWYIFLSGWERRATSNINQYTPTLIKYLPYETLITETLQTSWNQASHQRQCYKIFVTSVIYSNIHCQICN